MFTFLAVSSNSLNKKGTLNMFKMPVSLTTACPQQLELESSTPRTREDMFQPDVNPSRSTLDLLCTETRSKREKIKQDILLVLLDFGTLSKLFLVKLLSKEYFPSIPSRKREKRAYHTVFAFLQVLGNNKVKVV